MSRGKIGLLLRRILPRSWRSRMRELLLGGSTGTDGRLRRTVRFGRTLVAVYREARAVAAGQRRYFLADDPPARDDAALRRNIHRLEKGLIHQPRRDAFALDYIQETVTRFEEVLRGCRDDPAALEELQWVRDVLDEYFGAVEDVPRVSAARARFQQVRDAVPTRGDQRLAPFRRTADPSGLASYEQLKAVARHRRSVRWFEDRAVPRRLIDQAVEVASMAPSACNRQPFEFRIFDEPDLVQRVSGLAAGTKGFNQNFPAIAVVVGRLRAYFHEKDRHVIYIDAALASMSFVLALETMGLASCCINWPDVASAHIRMQEMIGLDSDERVVMLIAFGYPDQNGLVPYSGKKSLGTVAKYNEVRT